MLEKAIYELLVTRRTIQVYSERPVPDEVVQEALTTALYAPNHRLTHPWTFHWMGPETRKKIADLGAHLKMQKDNKPSSGPLFEAAKKNLLVPPHLIAIGCRVNSDTRQAREDYATVACGVQNISLYLWARGVGSKWTTGAVTSHEKTYEILGINPKEIELVGFLWVGHFDRVPPTPERPKLKEVLFRTN